jgi:hypothetical protein
VKFSESRRQADTQSQYLELQHVPSLVIPAEAGIQLIWREINLDVGFRRHDEPEV